MRTTIIINMERINPKEGQQNPYQNFNPNIHPNQPYYDDMMGDIMMQQQQYPSSPFMDASFIEAIKPDQLIRELEIRLGNYVFDMKKNEWVESDERTPLINAEGRAILLSTIDGLIKFNTTITWLKEEHIQKIMMLLTREIGFSLINNYKEWQIEKSNFNIIMTSILMPIFMTLRRAFEQGDRRFLKGSVTESFQTQPQKGGMFGRLFRRN